ncbi:hypothetical protein EGR_10793 [Echinococcus granulosus]|uniref:Uncharacterized protein n=1 Tax=Echinococcus granulosus TaxID=6210 RepID=W6U7K4_ECHGR|nr:hypothetical protein EGR_10793 [Echinococcus granulosus]EUB54347.1 hypothetical protein EGR_10793 [Echinococcus granulosus]
MLKKKLDAFMIHRLTKSSTYHASFSLLFSRSGWRGVVTFKLNELNTSASLKEVASINELHCGMKSLLYVAPITLVTLIGGIKTSQFSTLDLVIVNLNRAKGGGEEEGGNGMGMGNSKLFPATFLASVSNCFKFKTLPLVDHSASPQMKNSHTKISISHFRVNYVNLASHVKDIKRLSYLLPHIYVHVQDVGDQTPQLNFPYA